MSQPNMVLIEIPDPTPEGKRPVAIINGRVWVISPAQKRVLMALASVPANGVLSTSQAMTALMGGTPELNSSALLWCLRSTLSRIRAMINSLFPDQYLGFVQRLEDGYSLLEGVSVKVISSRLI